MENEAVKLKQIVSMIIIKKKIPEEIEKIVLASNKDYAEIARKLINAIKELDLTEIQKEKVKWIESYNENAKIQKRMAEKLITFVEKKEYPKILEIGCGTGFLTSLANLIK